MATCSTSDLMQDAECFFCIEPRQLEAIKVALLCKILQASDPMASCDVKSLMADAKCFFCLDPKQLASIQVQLLCEILTAGGGGGTGGVECGAVDPVADPGVTCAVYYNTATGSFWYWDDPLGIWAQLIGG